MVVLIFDTNSGLCNQFYDILNGINFCVIHNIYFTFRYCAFRNNDLITWTETSFEKLFDKTFLNSYPLYIDYYSIKDKLTKDNCYNLTNKHLSYVIFKKINILDQIINLKKEYVVLKQFWSLYEMQKIIDNTIYTRIVPCTDIMEKYLEIKNILIKEEPYNFIHYRHEKDFTSFFKLTVDSLDTIIDKIKFKNPTLKLYIATTSLTKLINIKDNKYKHLIYKNDDTLLNFNFEQRAFIDYMFGLHSVECYGHHNSSFSVMINNIKNTSNYYA